MSLYSTMLLLICAVQSSNYTVDFNSNPSMTWIANAALPYFSTEKLTTLSVNDVFSARPNKTKIIFKHNSTTILVMEENDKLIHERGSFYHEFNETRRIQIDKQIKLEDSLMKEFIQELEVEVDLKALEEMMGL
eukprot:260384_1